MSPVNPLVFFLAWWDRLDEDGRGSFVSDFRMAWAFFAALLFLLLQNCDAYLPTWIQQTLWCSLNEWAVKAMGLSGLIDIWLDERLSKSI